MGKKGVNTVSVISGADGPTSIFIAGKIDRQSVKTRIKNVIYRYRRKKVEKTIATNPHSLYETVQYAKDKYGLIEVKSTDREYIEQRRCLKESLIVQHKPEILNEMQEIAKPDYNDENSVREYIEKIKSRSEMIAAMPDNIIPMDFHIYRLKVGSGLFEMAIDYKWDMFELSYSGNKKQMKQLKMMSKDLNIYYGVSQSDIKNRTKRYMSLVTELSSF